MQKHGTIIGTAAPFMQANINTDRILPGEWMARVYKEGFAAGLFADERYLPEGTLNPSFILNRAPWNRAVILLADRNFGCGSTREEAPLALRHFGFRCLIAPSFPSAFFANCFRNGLLAVELSADQVRGLSREVEGSGGHATIEVDLEAQTITTPSRQMIAFRSPGRLRHMLMKGIDEIGLTLSHAEQIAMFREKDRAKRPWAYPRT